eukprot:TRINITY_DN5632_c0_g1_i1.p1 TRINITY_DN5632_c0_g1~~TRINITY_DN5632_c0_g1_i1.p1  ORF type:complete len:133 (+),score=36.56 TRINITY_DN5632_c0_g1_i1:18-416(+)
MGALQSSEFKDAAKTADKIAMSQLQLKPDSLYRKCDNESAEFLKCSKGGNVCQTEINNLGICLSKTYCAEPRQGYFDCMKRVTEEEKVLKESADYVPLKPAERMKKCQIEGNHFLGCMETIMTQIRIEATLK